VSKAASGASVIRTAAVRSCDDCRADSAFHAWHSFDLPAAFNKFVDFGDWHLIPKGKRAVIELVTAQILVPSKEWVRLRMYTSLGTTPSNLDLFVTHQGIFQGKEVYVATHSLRVYSDNTIEFNINRDNATTTGSGLICISGYIAG
jgi:hypothetical protein